MKSCSSLGSVGDNLLAVLVVANTRRGSAVAAAGAGADTVIISVSSQKSSTYLETSGDDDGSSWFVTMKKRVGVFRKYDQGSSDAHTPTKAQLSHSREGQRTGQSCREWRKRHSTAASGTSWVRYTPRRRRHPRCHLWMRLAMLFPNVWRQQPIPQGELGNRVSRGQRTQGTGHRKEQTYEWQQTRPCCGL
jgi:hypothetical protein